MKKKIVNTLCLGLVGVTAVSALASCGNKKTESNGVYTYRGSFSGEFSKGAWDPLTWQLNLDSVPLGYTTTGLYAFNYNSDKTSYQIDPELADAAPVDVSDEYGLKDDKGNTVSGTAYKVTLKSGAKFDNGVEITAQTFVDSYKLLIDAAYDNYRATTYESDGIVIRNSEFYHYKGQTKMITLGSFVSYADDTTKVEDIFKSKYLGDDKNFYASVEGTLGTTAKDLKAKHPELVFDKDENYVKLGTDYTTAKAKFDELFKEYQEATQDECDAYFSSYAYVYYTFADHDETWFDENVGIKALGTYELLFKLDSAIDLFNFEYNTSSTWLVEPEAYKRLTTVAADGTKSSTYNKTAETSVSYGPYKISSYTTTEYSLERNESWYGYSDAYKANYEGMYQTTNLSFKKIESDETCLMSFQQGDLDEVSLSADHVADYAQSSQKYITPETYLMSLFMNSNEEYLKALDAAGTTKNAVLVADDDFRRGLSYCINRVEAAKYAPGSTASAMMLDDLYMADAQNGVVYRDTTSGKSVYEAIYGTGATDVNSSYDVEKAVENFNKAYDRAVAAGTYNAGDEIILNIGLTNTTGSEYLSIVENVTKYLKAALSQSRFGNITVTIKKEGTAGYRYANLKAGKTVMAFCAWGGNAFSPYGFIQVYFNPDYNYMPGFDPTKETVTISIDGQDVKKTYYEWFKAVSTGKYSDAASFAKLEKDDKSATKTASQVYILSKLETAYLQQLEIIPIYALGTTSLVSYKVKYATEKYVNGVGYGGIQYLTYNYDDAEWESVKANVKY